MASRTWLAVSLMLFIWFGYMRWLAPIPAPTATKTATSSVDTTSKPSDGSSSTKSSSGPVAIAVNSSAFNPIELGKVFPVKTSKLDLVFSSNGGKLMEAKLNNFHETIDDSTPLITPVTREKSSLALGALFTDPSLIEFSAGDFDGKQSGKSLTFSRKNKTASVVKEYFFQDDSHFVETKITISIPKEARREWGSLLVPVGTNDTETFEGQIPLKSWELVYYQNDEIHRINLEKLRKDDEAVKQGHTEWVAFGNRYFSSAVITEGNQINPDIVIKKTEGFNGAYLRFPLVFKDGQKDIQFSLKYFIGPKDHKELSQVPGLKKLIDFGTFTVFAYPLLEILRFFYKFIHNYGIAIILLTLLVRALFYPLSQKSMQSMKAMQKLQPQIAALKEKYKDDQKKLNEEQMALFKAHKVNPAGGCLPMLVQLPVFIALYAVLGNAIELFHAPFFGWIQDLSTKDPYYIYPVLMGVAMLAQQKMTPSAGMDPAQQKLMYFMPVIFTFMMVNLPSGLTLYIFVSTILGVAQQLALKDKKGSVPQPA